MAEIEKFLKRATHATLKKTIGCRFTVNLRGEKSFENYTGIKPVKPGLDFK